MPAIDSDVNLVRKMFDVNLFGPIQMVHEFHPLLINAQGTIINIGSVGGIVPYIYGGEIFPMPSSFHQCLNVLVTPLRLLPSLLQCKQSCITSLRKYTES